MTARAVMNRADMIAALAALKAIAPSRIVIPILSHVLIETEAGRIRFRATDMDVDVSASCPAEIAGTARETCPLIALEGLARSVPEGAQIELTFGQMEGRILFRSGRSTVRLPTLPPAEFPQFSPLGDKAARFTIPADSLARLLTLPSSAVLVGDVRKPYAAGIFVHAQPREGAPAVLRGVATDGHRMIIVEEPMPDGAEALPGVIVPKMAAKLIADRVAGGEGDASIALTDFALSVTYGEWRLTTKLIGELYPEYQRIVAPSHKRTATTGRDELMQMVRRAMILADAEGKSKLINFDITAEVIKLTSYGVGGAAIDDELDVRFEGSPVFIGFNARYLLDALAILDCDNVELRMNDTMDPVLLIKAGDPTPGRMALVVPMRTARQVTSAGSKAA